MLYLIASTLFAVALGQEGVATNTDAWAVADCEGMASTSASLMFGSLINCTATDCVTTGETSAQTTCTDGFPALPSTGNYYYAQTFTAADCPEADLSVQAYAVYGAGTPATVCDAYPADTLGCINSGDTSTFTACVFNSASSLAVSVTSVIAMLGMASYLA